jgi:hypothetical protein
VRRRRAGSRDRIVVRASKGRRYYAVRAFDRARNAVPVPVRNKRR